MKTDRNEFITQRASALLTTLVSQGAWTPFSEEGKIAVICAQAVSLAQALANALEREGAQAWDAPPR